MQAIRDKIGSLYLGVRFETIAQRLYSSVFLARRLMYAILTIVCINNPNILIHVFLATNIIYIVYMGATSPNDTPLGKRTELFNESFLQLVTYHLALFPLALTLADEELLGWSMVGFIGFVFLANLVIMLTITVINLKRKCFLRKLKKQHEAKMKARQEKIMQQQILLIDAVPEK